MIKNDSTNNKVMKAVEVSAYLRLPRSTVYYLAASGRLRAVKLGRQWRFLAQDVYNYLHNIQEPIPLNSLANDKRCHPRIKSAIRAKLTGLLPETENVTLAGSICDISEGGIYISLGEEASNGNGGHSTGLRNEHPVAVIFELDQPTQSKLEIKGRIVRESLNGHQGFALMPTPNGAEQDAARENNPSETGRCCTGFAIKFRHLSKEDQEIIRNYVG